MKVDKKNSLSLPENLKDGKEIRKLQILQPWFRGKSFIFLILCIIWNSGLFLAIPVIIKNFNILVIIPLFIGVILIYVTLAVFINKTVIELSGNKFSIISVPLPWYGNKYVNISDLKQIACQEHKHMRSDSKIPTPPTTTYSVNLILKDDTLIRVCTDLEKAKDALAIGKKLEGCLSLIHSQ